MKLDENLAEPLDEPVLVRVEGTIPGFAKRTGSRLFLTPAVFDRLRPPVALDAPRRTAIFHGYPYEDLEQIREAVSTMSKQLDDILNLSRVNLSDENTEQLPLDEIINSAMKLVSREIEEHQVEVKIETNLPEVYAAPQRLTEVFQNLISNAAKFTASQENPLIEIGARNEGDWVHCFVSDNGIGIAAEYRDRVFNLFERLDTKTRGTGVGLAIVKRIIEHLGGKIWIESEGPGNGARFEFTLPAKAPAGP